MEMRSIKIFTPLFLSATLTFAAITATSCEGITSVTGSNGTSGDCSPTKAQIAVYDTFLQNLCGCQEAPGIVPPPDGLTCTVSAGTQVIFWYMVTTQLHQIQSTAQPTFPPSPVSDPNASEPITAWPVTLTTPGSYEFQDAYNRSLNGTIIVQ